MEDRWSSHPHCACAGLLCTVCALLLVVPVYVHSVGLSAAYSLHCTAHCQNDLRLSTKWETVPWD